MRDDRVRRTLALLIVCLAGWSSAVRAQSADQSSPERIREELDRLRKEFDEIKEQYDRRLTALEVRLGELESPAGGSAPTAPAPLTPEPGSAAPSAEAVPPPAQPSVPQSPAQGPGGLSNAKVFNPDMAVIGNFVGAVGRNTVVPMPALDMQEAEASFQAVVDPYARADFFLSFGTEGVDLEEGFVTFNTLPGDLLLKVGEVKEAFGKVNTLHSHTMPWADRPLVMTNLMGGEEGIKDSGVSVSRLLTNPLFFLEGTGEVFRSDSTVFQARKRSDLTYVGRLRGYRDLTEATNLDVGTSIAYGPTDAGPDTSARLIGVDATFRYRPLRRAIYTRVQARTELVWSRQELDGPVAHAFGWYASGEYQFARRWIAGVRLDRSERARDGSLHDSGGSVLLTYWPSEFSQVRGQYRHTRYAEGATADEFLFQFLFSIGAHGAHVF